jgi:hypothetical protein
MVHGTAALPFLTDLKNLKQIFIIDGYAKGLEDWEVRPYHRDFTFDLSDVRVGKVGRVLYVTSSWEIWSSGHVDQIRKCFQDQKSVVEATMDEEWVIPEILGKNIWRK